MCNWVWQKIKTRSHYLLGAASVFCLATNYLFLDAQNSTPELFCVRGYCFQLAVFSVVVSLRCCRSDFTVSLRSEALLHLARGLTGCCAYYFIIKAADMLDLDDIMNALTCVPVLVAVLSRFFLREKLKFSELTAHVTTVGGVVSICQPSAFFTNENDDGDEAIGSVWAAFGCVCLALTYVLQRCIRRTRLEVSLLSNAIVALAVLVPLKLATDNEVPDCVDVISALASGAFVVIAMIYQVQLSRLNSADRLRMLCAVHLPFTAVTEVLEFDQLPWWASYVGALAVGLCVAAIWFLQRGGLVSEVESQTSYAAVESGGKGKNSGERTEKDVNSEESKESDSDSNESDKKDANSEESEGNDSDSNESEKKDANSEESEGNDSDSNESEKKDANSEESEGNDSDSNESERNSDESERKNKGSGKSKGKDVKSDESAGKDTNSDENEVRKITGSDKRDGMDASTSEIKENDADSVNKKGLDAKTVEKKRKDTRSMKNKKKSADHEKLRKSAVEMRGAEEKRKFDHFVLEIGSAEYGNESEESNLTATGSRVCELQETAPKYKQFKWPDVDWVNYDQKTAGRETFV